MFEDDRLSTLSVDSRSVKYESYVLKGWFCLCLPTPDFRCRKGYTGRFVPAD